MQGGRKMDGRKESKREYGKRDPTPLESPVGQKPVTAVHCSASTTALQHIHYTDFTRSVMCLVGGGLMSLDECGEN